MIRLSFDTPEQRRAWAFAAILGGCIVMTLFAAVGVYLTRHDAQLAFYLALAAHAQVLVGMTAIGALLVRRTIKVTREGLEVSDSEVVTPPPAPSTTVTTTTEVK